MSVQEGFEVGVIIWMIAALVSKCFLIRWQPRVAIMETYDFCASYIGYIRREVPFGVIGANSTCSHCIEELNLISCTILPPYVPVDLLFSEKHCMYI